MSRSLHMLRTSCIDNSSVPFQLPEPHRLGLTVIPDNRPSLLNLIILPTGMIIPSHPPPLPVNPPHPLRHYIIPQQITPMEAKTDIKNRRRKMKRHQKRKWFKDNISLVRKLQMQQEKKEENKLQELFAFWRRSSEAFDPKLKVERHLNLARRSGYFIDILNSKGSPLYKFSK